MTRALVLVLAILLSSNIALAFDNSRFDKPKQWCFNGSFLWFNSVVKLSLSVEPQSTLDTYRIVLQGTGQGLVGWLNGDRHQRYESLVRLDSSDQVISLSHLQRTDITHNGQRIHYGWTLTFDETSSTVKAERLWGGHVVETFHYHHIKTVDSHPRVVGDFLSALFAFMNDTSHPLTVGATYDFLVFHRDGFANLHIQVLDYDDRQNNWQCQITSDSSCLPGDLKQLIFYCNDQRIPLYAGSDTAWGGVSLWRTGCLGGRANNEK